MDQKQEWKRWLASLASLLVLAGAGCGPVLSEGMIQQADPSVSFAALQANPAAYKNRLFILGGSILSRSIVRGRDQDTITYLEVLQHPLGRFEKPPMTDRTDGPFLLRCEVYLSLAAYAKGRLITVAGRVRGSYPVQIDEKTYLYPLLTCEELHLWPQIESSLQYYDPTAWWYGTPWLSDDYEDNP